MASYANYLRDNDYETKNYFTHFIEPVHINEIFNWLNMPEDSTDEDVAKKYKEILKRLEATEENKILNLINDEESVQKHELGETINIKKRLYGYDHLPFE